MDPQPISEWLYSTLTSLPAAPAGAHFADRVYPDAAPANTSNPCVVYQLLEAPSEEILDSGPVDVGHVSYQLRCYGSSRKSANAVRERIRQALQNCDPIRLQDWTIVGSGWGDLEDDYDREKEDYGALAVVAFQVERNEPPAD